MTRLEDHAAALRAEGAGDDVLGQATRLRLRASLDRSPVRRVPAVIAALAVLCLATASWALATGPLRGILHRDAVPPIELPVIPPHPYVAPTVVHVEPAPVPAPVPLPVAVPAPRLHRAPRLAPAPAPADPTPVVVPAPLDRYEAAHELHFHAHDYAAALAAWDAYLAADPAGRFVVEARYNRALCLVRLGRLAEARAALAPYARGEVAPAGYRQAEAKALVDRLDRLDARARP